MILENTEITKYTFSGHDFFQCRQLWLKKGYDYVQEGKNFNDEDAVVQLVVGKSIRYRSHSKRFVLFEGTDLNIQTALIEAGSKILKVVDITILGIPLPFATHNSNTKAGSGYPLQSFCTKPKEQNEFSLLSQMRLNDIN